MADHRVCGTAAAGVTRPGKGMAGILQVPRMPAAEPSDRPTGLQIPQEPSPIRGTPQRRASTWASHAPPSCPTAHGSRLPGFYVELKRSSGAYRNSTTASRKDRRTGKGSRVRPAKQHAKVVDRRRDVHHKISTKIISENQAVHVEDLAVAASPGAVPRRACMMPAGLHSSTCWNTRQRATAASSAGSTAGFRQRRDAAHNVLIEGRQVAAGQRGSAATASGGVRRRKAAVGALVRPRPSVPAQRDEAGTHPKPHPPRGRQAGVASA